MQSKHIQSIGIALTLIYGLFVFWLYVTAPRTLKEVATNTRVAAGTYEVDQQHFKAGLELFRTEQFRAAREEWALADPAKQDPTTQFYVAYSFYREGWGRTYIDSALYKQGLDVLNHAIEVAPGNTIRVDDADLLMHTAAELKAELESGTETKWSDLNPLKIFRHRK
jgi:hypothetical protein